MLKFWKYTRQKGYRESAADRRLQRKYQAFLTILSENEHVLHLISSLEQRYYGHRLVSIPYLRNVVRNLSKAVSIMVESLNILADNRYEELSAIADEMDGTIREIVSGRRHPVHTPIVIPLSEISAKLVDKVGGKMANLGELSNRLNLNVPDGFALTACAYQHFLDYNGLTPEIETILANLDINDSRQLMAVDKELKALFLRSRVPPEIALDIQRHCEKIERKQGRSRRWAVRSSALGEDTENTFAGQFSSLLNVETEQIPEKYKEVLASKYNARALTYRQVKHIRDEDINLSLGVMEMIHPETSGVLYTTDPLRPHTNTIIVNAVWGIGQLLADGIVSADTYVLQSNHRLGLEKRDIAEKEIALMPVPAGGIRREVLAEEKCHGACLSRDQLEQLAQTALVIENHFQCPQDIEWCFAGDGTLFILQARPLAVAKTQRASTPMTINAPILLADAQPLHSGVAMGRVCKISDLNTLGDFPEGAVLVARKSSPRFVTALRRAVAVVVEGGNLTDHMAPIVREFGVPCLARARHAFSILEEGREVTVDAYTGRIYDGKVPELYCHKCTLEDLRFDPKDTESYQLLGKLIERVCALRLTDPRAENFTPEHCRSWHDLIRFCHEAALNEMFSLSQNRDLDKAGNIYRVETDLPLDLHLLDLFHRSVAAGAGSTVAPQQVDSLPFQALWAGATVPGLPWKGPPAGTGAKGLRAAMLRVPAYELGTSSTTSFAVVTPDYLNLSLAMGFHYVLLDAYLSPQPFNNHITLSFKGGAATAQQRRLRAVLVEKILRRLDFDVQRTRDFLKARIKAESREKLAEKMDLIGRMLGVTRLLDLALQDETVIDACVERFFQNDYSLQCLNR